MEELADIGDYSGSPFLPSDTDIFLNDTDRDDIGNEMSAFLDLLLLPTLRFYFWKSTVRACSAQRLTKMLLSFYFCFS